MKNLTGAITLVLISVSATSCSYFAPAQPPDNPQPETVTPSLPTAPIVGASGGTQTPTIETFPPPTTVPAGTKVRLYGVNTTSEFNLMLKNSFENQFKGTEVETNISTYDQAILALIAGNIDIAAVWRPLTTAEKNQGLIAINISQDQIAIIVGKDNPYSQGLTHAQVLQIFQSEITDWSQLGGATGTIKVINRSSLKNIYDAFRELVLGGSYVPNAPNITDMLGDDDTAMLEALNTDGISYAPYSAVANQETVRILAIDGLMPQAVNYHYQRPLYYVYKSPANPAVKAFIGYALQQKNP
ncbi:MAG TPA: substrate-binding domain-containing protein [Oscillatoriaceae cyanobacterium M33_DOE_052]|uniref:Phosphate ABC transporter substrate-binding protein n=1 Tax=Planktothricoides sp. SpSt-374 TaxID=2282167 RepID=A0A7C3ZP43_9CYAN|nr:substrate-binding domain-containing protein [Oscillatoriaceae cyanobacterium M33_DOE_052]